MASVFLLSCTAAPPSYVRHGAAQRDRSTNGRVAVSVGSSRARVADRRCPVNARGSDVVLAIVGETAITGCEVYIEWQRRLRLGAQSDDPAVILRALIDEALLASRYEGLPPPEVTRELAEALVRHDALDAMEPVTDRELARWSQRHDDDGDLPARVRARHLVFSTRTQALSALRRLQNGERFEVLLTASIDPLRERDEGDLGYVSTERDDLPDALVRSVLSIATVGDWAAEPVRVSHTVTLRTHRRGRWHERRRTVVGWHLVQLVDRIEAQSTDPEILRRRARSRLGRERYDSAVDTARERWAERFHQQLGGAINTEALRTVRVNSSVGRVVSQ